jgi:hypothetical protein
MWQRNKRQGRPALKDKPLRNPGQSVEEARRQLLEDKVEQPFVSALLLLLIAGLEWWRSFSGMPPQPMLFTVGALCAVAFAGWRISRAVPQLKALRQAVDGEKAVGQFLEGLREHGYRVFHDLVGDGFNVDHVLIGPAGVFTVETKTWSKPAHGEPRVHFDGEKITRGTFSPDRDPVIQARAQAGWLGNLLAESTGRKYDVRPVVLFPGWFVEQAPASTRRIWVLNPKALPNFLRHEAKQLSDEEVKLAAFHLSRFIRAHEGRR